MKLPEEYWSRVERAPTPVAGPLVDRLRDFRRDVENVITLVSANQPDRVLVWRGQSDADFGLSSSLFRAALMARTMSELSEQRLFELEAEIISYARASGLGRGMNNLELLHALQHYSLPTRLVDVSRDVL